MDGLGKVKRILQFSYIAAIGTLILAALMVISLYSPFQPMQVQNVKLVPEKVCPLELVAVDGSTNLDAGTYHVTIDPQWIKIGDANKIVDEAAVDGEVVGPLVDRDTAEELVYVSPPERGKWSLNFEVSVEGRNLIMPRTQDLSLSTVNKLQVMDCGDTYSYEDFTKKS
jgi:hypothetical protein